MNVVTGASDEAHFDRFNSVVYRWINWNMNNIVTPTSCLIHLSSLLSIILYLLILV